ncbi:MAG: hypothetical protein Ct9H300mP11_33480 [Chloroflexota bacterium]|nr:MAG: hypothetical protein Ct9H300mP11_33480 [Chloroflexota bacterium]
MRLENKVALISGGARGIGAAVAKLFSKEGAKLIIGDILEHDGNRTAEEITSSGGNVTSCNWMSLVNRLDPGRERNCNPIR